MSSPSPCALQAPLSFPAPVSHLECEPGVYQALTGRVAELLDAGLGLSRALMDITIVLE